MPTCRLRPRRRWSGCTRAGRTRHSRRAAARHERARAPGGQPCCRLGDPVIVISGHATEHQATRVPARGVRGGLGAEFTRKPVPLEVLGVMLERAATVQRRPEGSPARGAERRTTGGRRGLPVRIVNEKGQVRPAPSVEASATDCAHSSTFLCGRADGRACARGVTMTRSVRAAGRQPPSSFARRWTGTRCGFRLATAEPTAAGARPVDRGAGRPAPEAE